MADLTFRPITVDDTDMVVAWRNNPRVVGNFLHREKVTREDHLNWLKTRVNTGEVEQYVILLGDRPVGCVYLRDIDRAAGECEYGVFIGEDDATGQGIGNATCAWAVERAREMGLRRMILRVLEGNTPALRSYERAGFTEYSRENDYIDGRDLIMMEIIL